MPSFSIINYPTKRQMFYSIIWITIILPLKGMLNPFWFLDSSFPDKLENNKKIVKKIFSIY